MDKARILVVEDESLLAGDILMLDGEVTIVGRRGKGTSVGLRIPGGVD